MLELLVVSNTMFVFLKTPLSLPLGAVTTNAKPPKVPPVLLPVLPSLVPISEILKLLETVRVPPTVTLLLNVAALVTLSVLETATVPASVL